MNPPEGSWSGSGGQASQGNYIPTPEEMARLGLSAEDIFLISPNSSFSPSKKKHRGGIVPETNGDDFEEFPTVETEGSFDGLDDHKKNDGIVPTDGQSSNLKPSLQRQPVSAHAQLRPLSSADSMDLPFEGLEDEEFGKLEYSHSVSMQNVKMRAPNAIVTSGRPSIETSPTSESAEISQAEMQHFLTEEVGILSAMSVDAMQQASSTTTELNLQQHHFQQGPQGVAAGAENVANYNSGYHSSLQQQQQHSSDNKISQPQSLNPGMRGGYGYTGNNIFYGIGQQTGLSSLQNLHSEPPSLGIIDASGAVGSGMPSTYLSSAATSDHYSFDPYSRAFPTQPPPSKQFQSNDSGSMSDQSGMSGSQRSNRVRAVDGGLLTEMDEGYQSGYQSSDTNLSIGNVKTERGAKAPSASAISRAAKSLSTISRRFVETFGDPGTLEYISGQRDAYDYSETPLATNRVDAAAVTLGVHVRRIYELIKILEILSLVKFAEDKRGRFTWKGTKEFLMTLGKIQAEGIRKHPDIARAHGLTSSADMCDNPTPLSGTPIAGATLDNRSPIITPRLEDVGSSAPSSARSSSNGSESSLLRKSLERAEITASAAAAAASNSPLATTSVAVAAAAGSGAMDDVVFHVGSSKSSTKSATQAGRQSPMRGGGYGTTATRAHRRSHSHGSGSAALAAAANAVAVAGEAPRAVAVSDASSSGGIALSGTGSTNTSKKSAQLGLDFSRLHDSSAHSNSTLALAPGHLDSLNSSAANSPRNALVGKAGRKRSAAMKGSGDASIQSESASAPCSARMASGEEQQFMVDGICRSFLQLFLLGLDHITMSHTIQSLIPMSENQTHAEYNKVNATKIRRVYDVANVLCSLNLIKKTVGPKTPKSSAAATATSAARLKDVHPNGELPLKLPPTGSSNCGTPRASAADSKLLEWTSFSPIIIREFYVARRLGY